MRQVVYRDMRQLIALSVLVAGCGASGVPLSDGDRCAWKVSAPILLSGSTDTTWRGGVPVDDAPRCNPSDGSNGYAASVAIWAPPIAMTVNLQSGVDQVAGWQDFTIETYVNGSQQASSSCQSWRNGSGFVSVVDGVSSAHVVADCASDDMHVDASVTYRL